MKRFIFYQSNVRLYLFYFLFAFWCRMSYFFFFFAFSSGVKVCELKTRNVVIPRGVHRWRENSGVRRGVVTLRGGGGVQSHVETSGDWRQEAFVLFLFFFFLQFLFFYLRLSFSITFCRLQHPYSSSYIFSFPNFFP